VPVEPQQREQLLEDREVLEQHEEQQRLEARERVGARGDQREDRVEVHAAEVGPQPAGLREPVGVGHVGVERRPDDVDADAHHARAPAAVAAGRGVADLVERGRQGDAAEQRQQQRRVVDDRAQRLADAVREEQPAVERDEAEHDGDHHGRQEQRAEDRRQRVREPRGDDGGAELQRQQRVDLAQLRARAVGRGHNAERAQLLVDQQLDGGAVDAAAEGLADAAADLLGVTPAVRLLGHHVEQVRQLDHLAVGAADDPGRGLEAGVLVLADELHAVGEPRRRCGGRLGAGRGRGRGGGHGDDAREGRPVAAPRSRMRVRA
jgi:hypothetical protein